MGREPSRLRAYRLIAATPDKARVQESPRLRYCCLKIGSHP